MRLTLPLIIDCGICVFIPASFESSLNNDVFELSLNSVFNTAPEILFVTKAESWSSMIAFKGQTTTTNIVIVF